MNKQPELPQYARDMEIVQTLRRMGQFEAGDAQAEEQADEEPPAQMLS